MITITFTIICLFNILNVVIGKSVFFSDSSRAVEEQVLDGKQTCYIHGDSSYIKEIYLNKNIDVYVITSEELNEIINDCELKNVNITDYSHQEAISRKKRSIVYPGTKWCGTGNVANNSSDLGTNVLTDTCCRKHDSCDISIAPLSSNYGLFNYRLWYLSHCTCDDELYNCLKAVTTESAAQNVGKVYFNFLKTRCIQETGRKIKQCIEYRWWGTCRRYKSVPQMAKRWPIPF